MGNINFISHGINGVVDDSVWTKGRIFVTGNPPEDVIGYSACLPLDRTIEACVVQEINFSACVVTQIYYESVKIVKKYRYYN